MSTITCKRNKLEPFTQKKKKKLQTIEDSTIRVSLTVNFHKQTKLKKATKRRKTFKQESKNTQMKIKEDSLIKKIQISDTNSKNEKLW